MRKLGPRYAAFGVALAIVLVLLLLWFLGWPREGRSAGETAGRSADRGAVGAASSFTISGNITGAITPGVMLPLDLSLENPNDVELSIDRITVSVHAIDAPRADADHPCSAADFEVRQLGGGVAALRLEAKGALRLSELDVVPRQRPALGMLDRPVNQDGCKGAFLTLGYQASGVEVHP